MQAWGEDLGVSACFLGKFLVPEGIDPDDSPEVAPPRPNPELRARISNSGKVNLRGMGGVFGMVSEDTPGTPEGGLTLRPEARIPGLTPEPIDGLRSIASRGSSGVRAASRVRMRGGHG